MKAYGYIKNTDAETPLKLKEVSLLVTLDEIQDLITFLQRTYEKHSQKKNEADHSYSHLKDFNADYKAEQHADFIIITEAK